MDELSEVEQNYAQCLIDWLSLDNNYSNFGQLDKMLTVLNRRIIKYNLNQEHLGIIIELIKILVLDRTTSADFAALFELRSFSRLLGTLGRADYKFEASRLILETMRLNLKLHKTNDHLILAGPSRALILKLFAYINDTSSLMALQADIEHLSALAICFIEHLQVSDLDDHLELLANCRAALSNLDHVMRHLCSRALRLAGSNPDHRKLSRKRHYLNSCLAFALVTIPAIRDARTRFNFFLEGSHTALQQISLSLADYYLAKSISSLKELICSCKIETQLANDGENRNELWMVEQMSSLITLMLGFEDYIDLERKLDLTSLVEDSFGDHSSLIKSIRQLNMVKCSSSRDGHDGGA